VPRGTPSNSLDEFLTEVVPRLERKGIYNAVLV
jgi:hypothetical protein